MDDDFHESDCCGNGCANCVLNISQPISHNKDTTGKQNIIGKYTEFLLINKTLHLPQVGNVWELHFKSKHCNNKNYMLYFDVGYHLMMRKILTKMEIGKDGKENERKYLLRPYSPFWWDVTKMEFKILVNLIPNGPMSEYIKHLRVNDEVEFRGPIGTFEHHLDERGDKCLLIISQGIAIASVIPIIENILNNEYDMNRIVHVACFKDVNNIYFRDKLYNCSKYWNYKVHIYLSKELCDDTDCINNLNCLKVCKIFKSKLKYREIVTPHRLKETDFQQIVEGLSKVKENTSIIISGSGIFQNYFKKLCHAMNLSTNIYLL